MGSLLVILLGIAAYKQLINDNRVIFFVIIQFLIFKCYHLAVVESGSVIRPDDMALVLAFLAFCRTKSRLYGSYLKIGKKVSYFLLFLCISILISIFIKEISVIQVLKESRNFVFVFIIYIVSILKKDEVSSILHKTFLLNSVFCVLFIIQIFMPSIAILSDMEADRLSMTGYLGFRRFYGNPPLIAFGCLYSFLLCPYKGVKKYIFIAINFAALLLVQSRSLMINIVLLVILSSVFFKVSLNKKIFYTIISALLIFFVNSTILSGDVGSKTSNDLDIILSGKISNMDKPEGEATLSYRIWLLVNRIKRINEGGLIDQIFGLGLFVDLPGTEIKSKSLEDVVLETHNNKYGLFTPDISYANYVAFLGYLGTFLFLNIYFTMIRLFYKYRNNNKFAQIGLLYMLYMLLSGFGNKDISSSSCLIIPFLLLSIAICINKELNKSYLYGRNRNIELQ